MSYREVRPEGGLKGKFALTPKTCPIRPGRQGYIKAEASEGVYFVQWYSWLDGMPTNVQIVPIDQMSEWSFYFTEQEWQHAGNEMTYGRKYDPPEKGENAFCRDHGYWNNKVSGCPGCCRE